MAVERLILVGAGGFGRELICWAEDAHAAGTVPALAGFIDDQVDALPPAYRVDRLGGIADYAPRDGDLFVVAMGSPRNKRQVVEMLRDRGGRFATLRHPTCTITRTADIGEGVIMCPYTMAMPDTRIGRFATLINYSGVGHDSVCGEFTTLSSLVDIMGNVTIGQDVMIGSGARVLPRLKVGDGAVVGAGATVMRSVRPGTTVYTEPAKRLKLTPRETT